MELLYEGKAKKVFLLPGGFLLHEFKDSATAFNGKKTGIIKNKGEINASVSAIIFKFLAKNGIKNHFVDYRAPNKLITKRLEMIPLEVVVRNIAAGSLSKNLGIKEGTRLSSPLIETYYKNDALGDPLINDGHIYELNMLSQDELAKIKSAAVKIDSILLNLFNKCDINLIDFKLEFGRDNDGSIILADEISPDTCRLWDSTTGEKMDKDRFRQDLGNIENYYNEILDRLKKVATP